MIRRRPYRYSLKLRRAYHTCCRSADARAAYARNVGKLSWLLCSGRPWPACHMCCRTSGYWLVWPCSGRMKSCVFLLFFRLTQRMRARRSRCVTVCQHWVRGADSAERIGEDQ
ncbi:unnamed protein product (plasmid) [Mycetohabitans rhizoxinica HKI 454]|uniref:Uncharacterized protein n=1 Tax=Mycetohabitans rhizoxinica (strain DSM 19002 / CIP 109453 / HKI 454) TaxID=882378 RepID=E5AV00_MYCRK|nr:unnamed protein product [Mycetohabitans rhizoxinica HKI 454]